MLKSILIYSANFLEALTEWTGKIIAWLGLFMVLTVVSVIILRNVFEISAIPLQESVSYMHAILFMLGAAFTLKHDGHVRVDVFYQHFSDKKKSIVDMLGFCLLLAPVCLFIYFYCIDYVLFNWSLKEGSSQPGGLPFLYILKALLIAMPITLLLQGFARFLQHLSFLLGWSASPFAPEKETSEASHV